MNNEVLKKSKLVKIVIVLSVLTLPVIVFISVFVVWPRIIESRVRGFCASIEIGSEQDVAIQRAQSIGLKIWMLPPRSVDKNDPHTEIRGWDGVGFDRSFCTLRALDGKIISKRVSHSS